MLPISDLWVHSHLSLMSCCCPSFQIFLKLLSCSWFLFLYRSEFLLINVCCIILSAIFTACLFLFCPSLSLFTYPACGFDLCLCSCLASACIPSLLPASLLSLFCPLRMIQWIGVVNASLTRQGTTEHWIRMHSQLIITHMAPIQLASICFIDCQGQNLRRRDVTS